MTVKNMAEPDLQEILNRAFAEGFRTIAVKECIDERIPGAFACNLFDIDAKFADAESVDKSVEYLLSV
jgi:N-carbamoylsarcosine amidase